MTEFICNICSAPMIFKYEKTILKKYPEKLFECTGCHHLRFMKVHWLEEAYSRAIAALDTGAVRRCLNIRKVLYSLLFVIYGFSVGKIKMVDYGGAAGLLARLLRDVGVDCYSYDKYADNVYSSAFAARSGKYNALSMIEVAEHIENPVEEFLAIVEQFQPDYLFISTQLFSAATPEDWWYFTPDSGQHISFFTEKSMGLLAKKMGYTAYFTGPMIIWAKEGLRLSPLVRLASKLPVRELIFMAATLLNRYSPQKDFELIEGKIW